MLKKKRKKDVPAVIENLVNGINSIDYNKAFEVAEARAGACVDTIDAEPLPDFVLNDDLSDLSEGNDGGK